MKRKIGRLIRTIGIATTSVTLAVTIALVVKTNVTAGSNDYTAITEKYVYNYDSNENTTETVSTVKNTIEETQKASEEVAENTQKTTETNTVNNTQKATEEQKATTFATQATPAAVPTQAATVPETKSQVTTSAFTDIVYTDYAGNKQSFNTVEEARSAIGTQVLSTAAGKTAAIANKSTYSQMATEVLNIINQYRSSIGAQPVVYNDNIATAAMQRAAESAYSDWNVTAKENGVKRHIRPNFTKASTIASEYGITGNFGENYGRGFTSAAGIVDGWKASSSHNKLMTSTDYTQCGIGIAQASNGVYYFIAIFN